jgi:ribonuclease P protein component
VNQRFRAQEHLRRPADFQRVYQRRCSAGVDWLVVYVCENQLAHNRLGLSASKRLGHAVQRNRVRRLLREAYRLSKVDLPTGYDIVLVPKSRDLPAFEEIKAQLVRLMANAMRRAGK